MKNRTVILLISVLVTAFVQVGCGGGGQEQEETVTPQGVTDSTISSEENATPQN